MTLQLSLETDNIFTTVNSPIIVNAAKYTTTLDGYKCITKILPSNLSVKSLTTDGIRNINNTTLQCSKAGSYSALVYTNDYPELEPQLFSFYVYQSPQTITSELLLGILNEELPNIYSPNDELNNADNFGMSTVISSLYQQLYNLFYNTITSIGSGNKYNVNWEFVYLGINNLLQNAIYPAKLLETLIRVCTLTSIQIKQMSIFISRLAYQYTGNTTPIQIVYNNGTDEYEIKIFTSENVGWQLGVSGRSELGVTTYLFNSETNSFLYVLCTIIGRLMPVQIKYRIIALTISEFDTNFNIAQVNNLRYIDESVNYDAYKVVNNNNNLNTRGYLLN